MLGKAISYTVIAALTLLAGSVGFAWGQQFEDDLLKDGEIRFEISYIDQPILAASESGMLINIEPEGTEVSEDQIVALTDTQIAELRRNAAYSLWQSLKLDNESDIRERYAKAQHDVAVAAHRQAIEANKRSSRAISQAELDRRELEVKAARLSIENAQHEREVAQISEHKEKAEYDLATAMAAHHQIKSPIDGVVVERLKQVGEFVQAGEEVVKVVRLNRLRAIGHIPLSLTSPREAKGRSVTLRIQAGPQEHIVTGTIVHTDTEVTTLDQFDVWAEFDNPEGFPIRPGMDGVMTLN